MSERHDNPHTRDLADDEPAYESLSRDELAQEIDRVSAEGLPAHPETGPRRITLMLGLFAIFLLLGGLVIGFLIGPLPAVVAALFGLAILLANPEVPAAMLRARDRVQAKRRVIKEDKPSAEQDAAGSQAGDSHDSITGGGRST